MDAATNSLQSVLVLLASSVLAVAVCRALKLPAMIGYVVTGLALGPHALGLVSDRDEIRHLAEFGVVFLMFSIGLEFSLPKLVSMRRVVFGLGLAQVGVTIALGVAAALALGGSWQAGVALGGILAMSSTAVVSKLLAERLELESVHGRQVMGVLLLQDLAVVPLLVLIPALGQSADQIGIAVAIALGKAAAALAVLLLVGPRLMRAWLGVVARRRSNELFVLNVLLITLLLAFVTGLAGLSLVLGALLDTETVLGLRDQHSGEEDIKPYRDVLLGLFFVTVGMILDPRQVRPGAALPCAPRGRQARVDKLAVKSLRRRDRNRVAGGPCPGPGGRIRPGAAFHDREPGVGRSPPGIAGRHDPVDAGGAFPDRGERPHRDAAFAFRMDAALAGTASRRGAVDRGRGAWDHSRLRPQRPAPGAAARSGGRALRGARSRPGAGARSRARGRRGGVRRQLAARGARSGRRLARCRGGGELCGRRRGDPRPHPYPRSQSLRAGDRARARRERHRAAHRSGSLRGGARGVRVRRDARLACSGLGRRAALARDAPHEPGAPRAVPPAARAIPRHERRA